MKRVGFVGCGYVFDHYMTTLSHHPGIEVAGVADIDAQRLKRVTGHYRLHAYEDVDALLADPRVDIVGNLTPIESHADISRAALLAGKHVYSEKPLATTMDEVRGLIALARAEGLRLSCAPSNALSATSQTMWKVVEEGAVGDVRLVYAEFDDNPVYLMRPEGWRSRTGAPWPYLDEYASGCTWEHVGYHLTWMCAIFGPVRRVTAFSKRTVPDKTSELLSAADTPDFSVACLDFSSGVTGRVTCSIAAPFDHRMRVIGNKGMVHADTYRHYEAPVNIETFTALTLNARKSRSVRRSSLLQRLFGVGGRRVPLVDGLNPGGQEQVPLLGQGGGLRGAVDRLKRRELGQQDKCLGLAELAAAIEEGRPHFPPPEFTEHLTELTLAIQAAGTDGHSRDLDSTFTPLPLPEATARALIDYRRFSRPGALDRFTRGMLDRLHRH